MILPILYKKTKTGKIQTYEVTTTEDVITVTQGQLNGKKQSYLTKCTPKNVGRSNATTGTEQAELEAKAKHAKKLKSGYTLNKNGKIEKLLPQKVKKYQDLFKSERTQKALILPCFVEPKLNGVNFTVRIEDKLNGYSRGGEDYLIPAHQVEPLKDIMNHFNITELNGEQYIHKMHLQDIQSAVTKTNDNSKKLVFYIFEIPSDTRTYKDKIALKYAINNYIKEKEYQLAVQVIIPKEVKTLDEIELAYFQVMTIGFEGLIITNARSVYTHNIRSSDKFKYKIAKDAEYKVVDFKIDKNKEIVLVMITKDGQRFNCKPKGEHNYRQELAVKGKEQIGKWWTIEYEMLSKAGVPLKPVALYPRKCDKNGRPLE